VQVDQDGVKRRVAKKGDIPAETRELADRFVEQRLLVAHEDGLEVAHEAILRQWPALAGWISEEAAALNVLDGVRAAAADWRRRGSETRRKGGDWLVHRGLRLKDSLAIVSRQDFAPAINAEMKNYLAACRAEERRQTRGRRRLQMLAALSGLTVVGTLYAFQTQDQWRPILDSYLYHSVYYDVVVPEGNASRIGRGDDVLYNGVRVGTTTDIHIDRDNSNRLIVQIAIPPEVPLRADDQVRVQQVGQSSAILINGGSPSEALLRGSDSGRTAPRLVALVGEGASAHLNRGAVYFSNDRPDLAIVDFDEAIRLEPQLASAHMARGNARLAQQQYQLAIQDFDEVIDRDANDAWALSQRCFARAAAKVDLDQALADCEASTRDAGGSIARRAFVRLQRGEYQLALADFDSANNGSGEDPFVLFGRGIARLRLGQGAEGRADLAHAAQIDPHIAQTYAGYGVTP
jgi:tetratricopeptide (TPR) repeat protein